MKRDGSKVQAFDWWKAGRSLSEILAHTTAKRQSARGWIKDWERGFRRNEKGIESLEWILIAALITGVAAVVFGGLTSGLTLSVQGILTSIAAQVP